MIISLDDHNILRLISTNMHVVDVVKSIIDRFWALGLEAEGRIGTTGRRRLSDLTIQEQETIPVSWQFVLKGSPWQGPSAKVGRSRQFVTELLDVLLTHGWTVVTGLDISR